MIFGKSIRCIYRSWHYVIKHLQKSIQSKQNSTGYSMNTMRNITTDALQYWAGQGWQYEYKCVILGLGKEEQKATQSSCSDLMALAAQFSYTLWYIHTLCRGPNNIFFLCIPALEVTPWTILGQLSQFRPACDIWVFLGYFGLFWAI